MALLAPLAIRALAEVGAAEAKPAIKTVVHSPGGSNGGGWLPLGFDDKRPFRE